MEITLSSLTATQFWACSEFCYKDHGPEQGWQTDLIPATGVTRLLIDHTA